MVCCVLTAALIAWIGQFVRRATGRDGPVVTTRPPPPVSRHVDSAEGRVPGSGAEADGRTPALVDA